MAPHDHVTDTRGMAVNLPSPAGFRWRTLTHCCIRRNASVPLPIEDELASNKGKFSACGEPITVPAASEFGGRGRGSAKLSPAARRGRLGGGQTMLPARPPARALHTEPPTLSPGERSMSCRKRKCPRRTRLAECLAGATQRLSQKLLAVRQLGKDESNERARSFFALPSIWPIVVRLPLGVRSGVCKPPLTRFSTKGGRK